MDWRNLIKEGKAQDEAAGINPMSNSHATSPEGHSDIVAETQLNGHRGSPQIDPQLLASHPPGREVSQHPRATSNQSSPASSIGGFDQQHASRMFGQHLHQRSILLQDPVNAGPLPLIPTHESEAHQALRQIAPELQALMDLFATAYETHDMAKVEELRKRLGWAIDSRGK